MEAMLKRDLDKIPKYQQSQLSVQNQIATLRIIARHFGLYDADDYLAQAWDKIRMAEQGVDKLEMERDRLQAIIDAHDLCHNMHGKVDAQAFADGCLAEQRKIYGCAPHVDQLHKITLLLTELLIKSRPIFLSHLELSAGSISCKIPIDYSVLREARVAYDAAFGALQPTDADRLEVANRRIKELEQQLANDRVGNMDAAVGP